mmetsp:Transcript_12634/g.21597  ORF Transcript_12634/g.21597 Transcript_12634/m.21597 type:complete len:219 (-) Transcript_12634:802-1458(-)
MESTRTPSKTSPARKPCGPEPARISLGSQNTILYSPVSKSSLSSDNSLLDAKCWRLAVRTGFPRIDPLSSTMVSAGSKRANPARGRSSRPRARHTCTLPPAMEAIQWVHLEGRGAAPCTTKGCIAAVACASCSSAAAPPPPPHCTNAPHDLVVFSTCGERATSSIQLFSFPARALGTFAHKRICPSRSVVSSAGLPPPRGFQLMLDIPERPNESSAPK